MHKKHLYLCLLSLLLAISVFSQRVITFQRLHYFYNSGWLVETANHVLVFDFIPHTPAGISIASLEQKLKPALSSKKNIIVFISHDHNDHFDKAIFTLAGKENIRYVLGWKYDNAGAPAKTNIVVPGDSLKIPGGSIYTHAATDDGSGFLVRLDGVSIYHSGDHALWVEELLPPFEKELRYIRSKTASIDLAFLPAARGMFTKCAYDSIIEKGIKLSIDILQPRMIAL